jgi:hypothetical protein
MRRIRYFCVLGALILFAADLPMFCQVWQSQMEQESSAADLLASFAGTVRVIKKKVLAIEVEESNTLQFNCSKKTRYYDGNKKLKHSNVQVGDHVSVEAKRAPDGTLDAINVRIEHRNAKRLPRSSQVTTPLFER